MRKAYFEPEHMSALVEIFHEAQRLLMRSGMSHSVDPDVIAYRILDLACEGMPPWLILAEVMPPISPEGAGLPSDGEPIHLSPAN